MVVVSATSSAVTSAPCHTRTSTPSRERAVCSVNRPAANAKSRTFGASSDVTVRPGRPGRLVATPDAGTASAVGWSRRTRQSAVSA